MKYQDDVDKIVVAYKEVLNIDISDKVAYVLWSDFSEEVACGWCSGIEDLNSEKIVESTKQYLFYPIAIVDISSSTVCLRDERFLNEKEGMSFLEKENNSSLRLLNVTNLTQRG